MFNSELTRAVQEFTTLTLPLSEKDLERQWVWKDHDEEGIRFAFFVTLQELRHLAVILATLRAQPTPAQHILRQYHAAYQDLQAALLGLSNEEAERAPAEGEWPIQKTYAHILSTEINFSIVLRYALEKHRAGTWTSERVPDAEADRLAGISDEDFLSLTKGPLDGMLAYHRGFHVAMIEEFSRISDRELEFPSTFWEETRFPINHRLHRFEAHLAQHTVQIDKTLVAIGQPPSESKRLLRKIYAALAEAEGMMIGAEQMDEAATVVAASSISERTGEIESLLSQS
jgi:DinB family protein